MNIQEWHDEQHAPVDWAFNPVAAYAYNIKGRADWLPDPSVIKFVEDFVTKNLPLDKDFILNTNEYWLPITILSTLDWIKIGGWWAFQYSNVGMTNDQYNYIFQYQEGDAFLEHNPKDLLIFMNDPNRNMFTKRWDNAGLSQQEHIDLSPFVMNVGFPSWNLESPPADVTEIIMWATMLWALSENGHLWFRDMDIIFDYTAEYNLSYLSCNEEDKNKEKLRMLDPRKMHSTNRQPGTCKNCGVKQYCVDGYFVASNVVMNKKDQTVDFDPGWVYLCESCMHILHKEGVNIIDDNVETPKCGNSRCLNTSCPNLPMTQDGLGNTIPTNLLELGQNRVKQFEQFVLHHGAAPRQLQGQTLDQVLDHFRT